jgi:integrase
LGKAESTILSTSKNLGYLDRHCSLDDPENVAQFIASLSGAGSYKANLVKAYNHYVKFNGLSWEKPKYRWEQQKPKIPSTETLNSIIERASKKYATIFKILMECGMSPYELSQITLKDMDLEKGLINCRGYKGHSSRTFKLKAETLAMLKWYVGRYTESKPFPKSEWIQREWRRLGTKTAKDNPSVRTIRLYDLRHYYGTMTYYKTKDILYTKTMMGHKKIETTLLYAQLIGLGEDEWTSAVARDIKTACSLIEQGFEYIMEMDGIKVFRKRK